MTYKFSLGQTVATPGALDALERNGQRPVEFLERHRRGDWGDCDEGDKLLNDEDLAAGGRLLSVYHLADESKIWIITEADRSVTTILLPEDY